MRLAWATDVHLNFVDARGVTEFADQLVVAGDAVLLTGDIAEAESLDRLLEAVSARVQRPLYFVLGNHDFYGGSIAAVRAGAAALSRRSPWLRWLPVAGVVALTPSTALVGHDGWADGRAADFARSTVMLNDYRMIRELLVPRAELRIKLGELGDEAAAALGALLEEALARFDHVIVATHVPPFREACWYDGKISDDNWAPHFTCVAVGEALREVMLAHPAQRITVLCGHTHGRGRVAILPNLEVLTGAADYGAPAIEKVLEVD